MSISDPFVRARECIAAASLATDPEVRAAYLAAARTTYAALANDVTLIGTLLGQQEAELARLARTDKQLTIPTEKK